MATIFAIVIFLVTQLSLERKLAVEHLPTDNSLKQACPHCGGSHHTIKNGFTHNGKHKRQCTDCGRQIVINPTQKTVPTETKQLIDKLLLELISLRRIARVTDVSCSYLQNYVNNKFHETPRQASVSKKQQANYL